MTAVQELKYLFDNILKDRGIVITWDIYIEQEKQQMKDVYMENVLRPFKFNFEEYYNETYKHNI